MTRTKEQSQRLYAIFARLGIDQEAKEDMVYKHTNGRTNKTSAMTYLECDSMIKTLNEVGQNKRQVMASPPPSGPAQRMRRKILSICHELGWEKPGGAIDWKILDDFMINRSYLHKLLNDYTEAELPKLVTQFEDILKKHYK